MLKVHKQIDISLKPFMNIKLGYTLEPLILRLLLSISIFEDSMITADLLSWEEDLVTFVCSSDDDEGVFEEALNSKARSEKMLIKF